MFDRIKRLVGWSKNVGKWHRTTNDHVFEVNYETEHGVSVTHYIAKVSIHEETGEKKASYGDMGTTFYTNAEWNVKTALTEDSDYSTTICLGIWRFAFPKDEYEDQL